MNELTCGCEYVDSLILKFCELHQYPGPESHKDGKGIIIRDLEGQIAKLHAEVERLGGVRAGLQKCICGGTGMGVACEPGCPNSGKAT